MQARRVRGGHAEVDDELLDLPVRFGMERLALVERERPGSKAERDAQSRRAAPAAASARCASSRVPSGIVPSDSPVAGLVASKRAPDSDSAHVPPITIS